jgi:hypothetical protein
LFLREAVQTSRSEGAVRATDDESLKMVAYVTTWVTWTGPGSMVRTRRGPKKVSIRADPLLRWNWCAGAGGIRGHTRQGRLPAASCHH